MNGVYPPRPAAGQAGREEQQQDHGAEGQRGGPQETDHGGGAEEEPEGEHRQNAERIPDPLRARCVCFYVVKV